MIICGHCGTGNDDGAVFCGNCGRYLEFAAAEAESPGAKPADGGAPGRDAPGTTAQPVAETTPGSPATTGPSVPPAGPGAAAPPAPAAAAAASPPGAGTADAAPPVTAASGRGGGDSDLASPLIVPVESPGQGPEPDRSTAAVRPGVPAARRRPLELPPEDRVALPGELVCGNCGAGNAPTRRFCRRCGADLRDAPVVPPPPWWRRLFAARPGAPAVGYRPRRVIRRSYGPTVLALVLALLAAAVWAGRAPLTRLAAAAVDRAVSTRSVDPVKLTATSSAPGHPPRLLHDGTDNLFWAPAGTGGDGRGQRVDVWFRQPFRLVAIVVRNGASGQPQAYLAQARPRTIRVTFIRDGGPATDRDFVLNDQPGPQDLFIGVDSVTAVRITILDANGVGPGRLVALAELDFRGRGT